MTELSYTAWDDNRYRWPPPEGWYQASDGKWWPEGYGPVVDRTTTETDGGSDGAVIDDERGSLGAVDEAHVDEAQADEAQADRGEVDENVDGEHAAADFDPGSDTAVPTGDAESDGDHVDHAAEEFDASVEAAGDAGANGIAEVAPADESEHDVDLDAVTTGFADSTESGFPADSPFDSESSLSASSAGMAASGFAPQTESGSSSLGLAGWAQSGASDVGNRVDVGQEYDYSPSEGESTDLLDPVEESGHDHDLDAPGFDTSAEPVDGQTEPVDSTLSRLDDLKRQVEQQSFPTHVGGADSTAPASDVQIGGFDPTETLDIDPNDLTLESNPYYGGAADTETYATTSGGEHDGPLGAGAFDGDGGVSVDPGVVQGYGEPADTDPEAYGLAAAGESGEPVIEAPQADETGPYPSDGEPAAPAGDQPIPMAAGHDETQTGYSGTQPLPSMSSPATTPGRSRTVLYAVIGLLALAVAGVAGYLLFQLQSDDDVVSGDDTGATAAVGGSAAGPSDTSGQEPGSFSNPHELAGGVRLTVPLSEDVTEVWMLQVREPATSNEVGDELVEVTSRIRVRNDSTGGDLTASDLRFVLVAADGSSGTTSDESCSSGDDLNRQAAIEPGMDIEGNVCWTVPAAQASGALLGIESVHAGGRIHVELS